MNDATTPINTTNATRTNQITLVSIPTFIIRHLIVNLKFSHLTERRNTTEVCHVDEVANLWRHQKIGRREVVSRLWNGNIGCTDLFNLETLNIGFTALKTNGKFILFAKVCISLCFGTFTVATN